MRLFCTAIHSSIYSCVDSRLFSFSQFAFCLQFENAWNHVLTVSRSFPVELGDLLHPVAPAGQELGENTLRLFILSQSERNVVVAFRQIERVVVTVKSEDAQVERQTSKGTRVVFDGVHTGVGKPALTQLHLLVLLAVPVLYAANAVAVHRLEKFCENGAVRELVFIALDDRGDAARLCRAPVLLESVFVNFVTALEHCDHGGCHVLLLLV